MVGSQQFLTGPYGSAGKRDMDTSPNKKYRVEKQGWRSYDTTSKPVCSRCFSTYNSFILRSKDAPKISNKLGLRFSNLKSIYNSSSPIFKELFFSLNKKFYSTDAGIGPGSKDMLPPEELTTKNSATQTQEPNLTQSHGVGALPQQPIMSLRDIIEYKEGLVERSPYQGLLKNKENTKFKFGMDLIYPNPNEYSKFKDICD